MHVLGRSVAVVIEGAALVHDGHRIELGDRGQPSEELRVLDQFDGVSAASDTWRARSGYGMTSVDC